jgi:hypothetical protein
LVDELEMYTLHFRFTPEKLLSIISILVISALLVVRCVTNIDKNIGTITQAEAKLMTVDKHKKIE